MQKKKANIQGTLARNCKSKPILSFPIPGGMAVSRHTLAIFPSHHFLNEAFRDFRLGESSLFYPVFFLCQKDFVGVVKMQGRRREQPCMAPKCRVGGRLWAGDFCRALLIRSFLISGEEDARFQCLYGLSDGPDPGPEPFPTRQWHSRSLLR